MVSLGGSVHRLSATASVAGGLPVPGLWGGSYLDDGAGTVSVRRLSAAELADSRDDFRGYAQAPARLVRGHVVRHQPEKWRECVGPAAYPGLGQLPNGLGVVA